MDAIIKSGIWGQRTAETAEQANRRMAKTCNECDIKHLGHCYCDKGYECIVEREHEKRLIELESDKKYK